VAAAQAGDRRALDTLLRAHQGRIHALCRRMTRSEADAQDATQEALVAVVRGLRTYDGRARFSTWAHRVATNACIDHLRRQRRVPEPGLPEVETPPSAGAPPLEDRVGDRLDIDDALATLAPEFRAAVVLRDQLGLDYAEIAEVLGIPPGTVRSRIARGRAALAEVLGNSGDGSDVGAEAP
jgi:RNA polymerase sigma-70 factor (ECF subfamily)